MACSAVQGQCQPGSFLRDFPFSLSFHVGCSVFAQPRAIRSPLHPYFTVALFTSGSSVSSSVAGVPKSSILLDLSTGAFLAYLLMHPLQDTSKMHFINLNNLRLYSFSKSGTKLAKDLYQKLALLNLPVLSYLCK